MKNERMFLLRKNNSKEAHSLPRICFEGERVFLRPPEYGDWSQWAAVRERNRKILVPVEPKWPAMYDRSFWESRMKKCTEYWVNDQGYCFLVFENYSKALIGEIRISNVSRGAAQFASICYWLDEKWHGKGVMYESLLMVLFFAFSTLNLHRINAFCLPENHKSANLLKRLGFAEEGKAEGYIKINGKWEDHLLFGLNCENFTTVPVGMRS